MYFCSNKELKKPMIKEACIETFEEAQLAEKRGASRVELCADLLHDGLTPSLELMEKVCTTLNIPVMTMARPRAGNFVYNNAEIEQIKKDIDQAKRAGAAGVVIGLLTSESKIDIKNTRMLTDYAQPLAVTFHKAIDELENPVEGVKELLKINGITRILTSGGKATALEGKKVLQEMIKVAGDQIIILVAGKVLDSNLEEVQQETGAQEMHGRRIVGQL